MAFPRSSFPSPDLIHPSATNAKLRGYLLPGVPAVERFLDKLGQLCTDPVAVVAFGGDAVEYVVVGHNRQGTASLDRWPSNPVKLDA